VVFRRSQKSCGFLRTCFRFKSTNDQDRSELELDLRHNLKSVVAGNQRVSHLAIVELEAQTKLFGHVPDQSRKPGVISSRLARCQIAIQVIVDPITDVRVQLLGQKVVIELDPAANRVDASESGRVNRLQDTEESPRFFSDAGLGWRF
jgi:hypothetical protein